MRRLLGFALIGLLTIFIATCSDSGTGPDPDDNEEESTTYTVTMDASPSEAGTVSPSADSTYDEGEEIELQATPNEEYVFAGWTGDVESDDNPHLLTVDQDYAITANFERKSYELTIHKEGEGSVDENVLEAKSKEFEHGSVVELTANPAEGYRFVKWKGDVTGTENPAQITVDEPKELTAVFEKKSYPLTINTEGEGGYSEEVIQAKPTDYEYGTVVEVTANPSNGWKFTGWEGANTSADNPIEITVDSPKEVTAIFERKSFEVSTKVEGEGDISKSPDQNSYAYESSVTLEATPQEGYTFVEWTGDVTGTENPTEVTVDADKNATAVFEKKSYALTVNTQGEGTVTKSPNQAEYTYGTIVEVTASPDTDWKFDKWQGDVSGSTNTIQVTVEGVTEVKAVFTDFYVAENGVTVKCTAAEVGDTGTIDGTTFTKRTTGQITPDNAETTCTSGITDMSGLFEDDDSFNGDISSWDVSSVTDMSSMFENADAFDGDLSSWDVGNVTDMFYMFSSADLFNRDLSNWDVSNVTNMESMFSLAGNFNGDLSSWDVSNVTNMRNMFRYAGSFNKDISNWNVGNVTDMSQMFRSADSFNRDLSQWDVSNVTDMKEMFLNASVFNEDLSGWCVSQISAEPYLFSDNSSLADENKPDWGNCP